MVSQFSVGTITLTPSTVEVGAPVAISVTIDEKRFTWSGLLSYKWNQVKTYIWGDY